MGKPRPIPVALRLANGGYGSVAYSYYIYLLRLCFLAGTADPLLAALGEIPENFNHRNEGSGVFKVNQEREYWENRYSTGGDSGWCSVGDLRDWRWKIISRHTSIKDKSVLDVGCGDLRFWEGKQHNNYTGIDISSFIIEKNRLLRPDLKFFRGDAADFDFFQKFDVVLCLEMLFHIMTEASYVNILANMNEWASEYLFISCWSERPEPFVHSHYQAHYQLEDYLEYLPDLKLIKRYTTKTGLRALYVFTRKELAE